MLEFWQIEVCLTVGARTFDCRSRRLCMRLTDFEGAATAEAAKGELAK